jgi:hypothetical protein
MERQLMFLHIDPEKERKKASNLISFAIKTLDWLLCLCKLHTAVLNGISFKILCGSWCTGWCTCYTGQVWITDNNDLDRYRAVVDYHDGSN